MSVGGWLPTSTTQPGVRQPQQAFPCGDNRTWSVTLAKDLTGYSAEWRLGRPSDAVLLGLLGTAYQESGIAVFKASGANLTLNPVAGGAWTLAWATTYADTVNLDPGLYWHQGVVIDPQGNPVTVAEGQVNLTPSLRALQFGTGPIPVANPAQISFAIWQGDSTPPQVWGFQNPDGTLIDLTGSVLALTITNGSAVLVTARSDDGTGGLTVNLQTSTVAWNYTSLQSAGIPTSGATYQLHRLVGGSTQLLAHGSVVGLVP